MAGAACHAAKTKIETKAPFSNAWRMKASGETAIAYFCFACSGEG
jgi:hypothetical protein